jgi:uncharacterized protein YdhG (YjbR/CyaY superfamily)
MAEATVSYEQYLANLPADRRAAIEEVWNVIRRNVPEGYMEFFDGKFLSYKLDKDWLVALANQKNHISLYLMPMYVFPELKAKLDGAGKNLKCGKSCINFKRAEDLPLETIGEIIASTDPMSYREAVEQARRKC